MITKNGLMKLFTEKVKEMIDDGLIIRESNSSLSDMIARVEFKKPREKNYIRVSLYTESLGHDGDKVYFAVQEMKSSFEVVKTLFLDEYFTIHSCYGAFFNKKELEEIKNKRHSRYLLKSENSSFRQINVEPIFELIKRQIGWKSVKLNDLRAYRKHDGVIDILCSKKKVKLVIDAKQNEIYTDDVIYKSSYPK